MRSRTATTPWCSSCRRDGRLGDPDLAASGACDRLTRRFRDRVTIALETHVATLQASVPGLELQERPDYLDRLAVLRNQVFVLDHMYLSLLDTIGWIVRVDRHHGAAGEHSPRACAAGRVRGADRGQLRLAAGGGAAGGGTVRPAQPARRAPVRHGDQRRRRQGGPGHRHRPANWQHDGVQSGSAGSPPSRAPAGSRLSRTRWPGRSSGWATSARWSSSPSACTPRSARCCSFLAAGARLSSYVGARWARSASCAASGWTVRGGWSGWRTTPPR